MCDVFGMFTFQWRGQALCASAAPFTPAVGQPCARAGAAVKVGGMCVCVMLYYFGDVHAQWRGQALCASAAPLALAVGQPRARAGAAVKVGGG